MSVLSMSEQLLYSTAHISAGGPGGDFHGTGFFYQAEVQGGVVDLLITNKHVIEDCDRIQLRFHEANDAGNGPSGKSLNLQVQLRSGSIVNHPDPDVDLCAINVPFETVAQGIGRKLFAVPMNAQLLLNDNEWSELDAYEEILMIGCPNGLYDEHNNVPIFRRGITSSHPALRYAGRDEFVIDAACFPGSSGSPVMLFDTAGHFDRTSRNFMLGQRRVRLLGVLYAGPTISNSGEIVLTRNAPVSVSTMMHLGFVIRSSRIVGLVTELKRLIEKQQS